MNRYNMAKHHLRALQARTQPHLRPTPAARARRSFVLGLLLSALAASPAALAGAPVIPLPHAHAHNDYEHRHPLSDALAHGFCGVEADIHLVKGKLLVAHDLSAVRPDRTLEALYLQPLRFRARRHHGRIYPHGPSVVLLIDIKSEAASTYAVLRPLLARYRDILTVFYPDHTATNAVTAILSGNRPKTELLKQPIRYAAYDGRLSDLGSSLSPAFMPWISDNWSHFFSWRGKGPFPSDQERKLDQFVARVHQAHRQLRFWATPDRPEVWNVLRQAGVDWIGADHLDELQRFFLSRKGLVRPRARQ